MGSYVEATRNVADAANAVDAHAMLISTDWVFDGTRGPAAEAEPPQPVNVYGFLKAASELVMSLRSTSWTIARLAAVHCISREASRTPQPQGLGFGHLVAAPVEALRAGVRFTVWDGPGVNLS